MAVSSSLTILMTCWPGLKLWDSSRPTHLARTAWVNPRTTPSSTSASRRAVRISRNTSSTSSGLSRPRLRRRLRIPSNRSVRLSNMGALRYRTKRGFPTAPGLAGSGANRHWACPRPETAHRCDSHSLGRRGNQTAGTLQGWFPPAAGSRSNLSVRSLDSEQRVNEGGGVEVDKVTDSFAQTDQLHRQTELSLNGDHDAALGRSVQLGEHDPGHIDRIREDLGLRQSVLPGRGVEDQQDHDDLSRRPVGHPPDLLQFLDQIHLVVKAAGGVGQHHAVPLDRKSTRLNSSHLG